jgi:hypothetical protein
MSDAFDLQLEEAQGDFSASGSSEASKFLADHHLIDAHSRG